MRILFIRDKEERLIKEKEKKIRKTLKNERNSLIKSKLNESFNMYQINTFLIKK